MKKMISKMFVLCIIVSFLLPTQIFAQSQSDWLVDIGDGIVVDVENLAEKNGVNPYALRESIINGLNSEKFSPFSSVPSLISNSMASESVALPLTRGARAIAKKENQDSTAYTATAGSKTASNKTPAIGMCAMHVNVTTKTGTTTNDVVRLGTKIYMDNYVDVNGTSLSSFVVEDRGTVGTRSKFWIDIYFGLKNATNDNAAINYGVKSVSYSYIY